MLSRDVDLPVLPEDREMRVPVRGMRLLPEYTGNQEHAQAQVLEEAGGTEEERTAVKAREVIRVRLKDGDTVRVCWIDNGRAKAGSKITLKNSGGLE